MSTGRLIRYTEWRKHLIRLCVWMLGRLVSPPRRYDGRAEVEMKMLSQLYQTQAVRDYLDRQEDYVIRLTADAVASGHTPDAKFTAGRLMEIRSFRDKLAAAYAYAQRQKRAALAPARRM